MIELKPLGLVVVIENKIDAAVGDGQLLRYKNVVRSRYPGFKHLLVLLTPDGIEPDDDDYIGLSYSEVADVVEQTIEKNDLLGPDTLADCLKKLKGQVRLEHDFKESLYRFREMRNTFIHNPSEIPGWNISTADGREKARNFLLELTFRSLTIAGLFMTLPGVSAKEEFGKDLFDDTDTNMRMVAEMLEAHFGEKARAILASRYRKPRRVTGR